MPDGKSMLRVEQFGKRNPLHPMHFANINDADGRRCTPPADDGGHDKVRGRNVQSRQGSDNVNSIGIKTSFFARLTQGGGNRPVILWVNHASWECNLTSMT
jgi:hypothetical protein